jgi:hypothetical protein
MTRLWTDAEEVLVTMAMGSCSGADFEDVKAALREFSTVERTDADILAKMRELRARRAA